MDEGPACQGNIVRIRITIGEFRRLDGLPKGVEASAAGFVQTRVLGFFRDLQWSWSNAGRGGLLHWVGRMKQLTLATMGFERYGKLTRRAAFLPEMERVVPWLALCGCLAESAM
jgi:hypothetical protein